MRRITIDVTHMPANVNLLQDVLLDELWVMSEYGDFNREIDAGANVLVNDVFIYSPTYHTIRKPDYMEELPAPLKSYITADLLNGDAAKIGVAYIFFPITDGYPTGDPDAFRWTPETDDLWRQTLVYECESLEAANEYRETFQRDV